MPSKALEVNLASSRVDVSVSKKHRILQEVMAKYQGIMKGLNTFLEELAHPYRNWSFIVKEARGYALNYFHLLKAHQKGPEASRIYIDVFAEALEQASGEQVKTDAADNLLLYLRTIITESGDRFPDFKVSLDYGFDLIHGLDESHFLLFVKSYYQINKVARTILKAAPINIDYRALNRLLEKYLRHVYTYWLNKEEPLEWFCQESGLGSDVSDEVRAIFALITHDRLTHYQGVLTDVAHRDRQDSETLLRKLMEFPGFNEIVDVYRTIPFSLFEEGEKIGEGNYWKLIFLFFNVNNAGLALLHEETLREINRTMTWIIENQKTHDIQNLIQKTFSVLKTSSREFPATALDCVRNMGMSVYKIDDSDLVDFFIDSVIELEFQTPDFKGVGDDWQMRANAVHIYNIRTWLELIEFNPKWSKKLLSSLIIYLSLGGVFIKDTDLFPRDITNLLNSEIGPVYNLVKQLSRLFPVYFNEIGAEGLLREISTRIDEVCRRQDVLIHFLRKQSHVESSNKIIGLMEATVDFWRTKNREVVQEFVPPNIFEQIESEGPYIDGVHLLINHLFQSRGFRGINDLLKVPPESIKEISAEVSGVSQTDVERVELAITFYKLLNQKYHLSFTEFDHYLNQLQLRIFPYLDKLREALGESDPRRKIYKILSYLARLKGLILSPEAYEVREDIYRKRHFAVDIPSMYGSYHEMKFDALGLTLRLESLVNVLFEELVDSIELKLITRDTFVHIYDYLTLFYRALQLDGILSSEMERQLDLLAHSLKVRGFSFTQFLDIFKGFSQSVRNIVNDHFNNIHQQNLIKILGRLPQERLLSKYKWRKDRLDQENHVHIASEIFLRERIATALGLQQLDLFLSRIMNTLFQQADKLPREGLRLLLNYDPQKVTTPINPVHREVSDIIYLGNKGLNLVKLNQNGFPVPPGFIITTEIFRCRDIVDNYPPANDNLRSQIEREIRTLERLTGKSFGQPKNPLLLSVRSGAPISQPGMMDTFLDVGVNEDIVQGIIALTRHEWFAWDCYRRFLQSYGMAFGLMRNEFDDIIGQHKTALGVPYKKDFSGDQMRSLALKYKDCIRDYGIIIEESPFEQLYVTIKKVFDSWNTTKARTYRNIIGISNDWGTAVTVQQMVFGNLTGQSGSGVVFTHSPRWSGDMINLWGDFTLANQGEDVVSGLVKTLPISVKQAEEENRDSSLTLETDFPEIYDTVRELAKNLIYGEKWGPQEMEFTFESPAKKDLYFLQTRDMTIREIKKVLSFVTTPETESRLLGHGIGVSGGAMTGRVVFNSKEISKWRQAEPETSLILVRGDTVPDDIKEIYEADGLLTARGGSTSHAAIVAHRLGKTCVVGCAGLICMEKESSCSLDHIRLKAGNWLSIDGREGSIYSGVMKIKEIARE
ncbi:MAG: PEP/pyruvate-binding domain-containing protein [Desulfatiglans sp.]|jgi:pyruvate,orthophosphate dikinase|nr:PEP/pyruvate-binding domain-containing protein [Desulfatiglans sp.]